MSGFFQGEHVRLALKVPKFPNMEGVEITGDITTQSLCKPFVQQIQSVCFWKSWKLFAVSYNASGK
jgi:hypothetical protein